MKTIKVRLEIEKPGLFGKKKRADDAAMDPANQWVMLFGASPLGRNINLYHEDGDDSTWSASHAPSGLHNVDPVLWLLYCAGVFPARKIPD